MSFRLRASLSLLSVLGSACLSPPPSGSEEAPGSPSDLGSPNVPSRGNADATTQATALPLRAPTSRLLPPGHEGDAADSSAAPTPSRPPGPPASDASAAFGAWETLTNMPPFLATGALLLTDGTVMVSDSVEASKWWRLTPDKTGSYVNGTWSSLAQMPSGYEPTFFSSAVLADGRVIVIGGEYNEGAEVETNLGAIYDPVADLWTPVEAPNPVDTWYIVGDAPSVVLADGTFMIGNIEGTQLAYFDERALTWTTAAGRGKADWNGEEGWTLLPNGKVLTLDVGTNLHASTMNSELYDPATQTWSTAGSTVVQVSAFNPAYEIGPAMLLPNGSVFATGGTSNTSIYEPDGGWTPGPAFPSTSAGPLDITDGCAALLPNGNVLCVASPGLYESGAAFFEYDGTALNPVAATANYATDSSFNVFLLLLPSGQVLSTDDSNDVEVYTATGSPQPAWAPTISSAPSTVVRGTTYRLEGTQFNGLSQAVAYGDDYQAATNYPLVRITNGATGDVIYGRTHDHSTMAVATGSATVSTLFEAPAAAETGASTLVVVANGIPSAAVAVTIQ